MRDGREEKVELRCPRCRRFIAEVKGYGRGVCRECGSEVSYRSKDDLRNGRCVNATTELRV